MSKESLAIIGHPVDSSPLMRGPIGPWAEMAASGIQGGMIENAPVSCSLAFLSAADISRAPSLTSAWSALVDRSDVRTLPLRPAVHHILLALNGQDRHGLGIAEEIERISGGALELGPGTLYRSLAEMTEAGLIVPVAPPERDADPRRKHYRIRPAGRDLLARETARLGRLLETARAQGVLAEQE
jgi:DNA-binding PadR family transcriptional regulator